MPELSYNSRSDADHLRARLENSQRIAGIGDWEMDLSHRHLHWSDEIYRILDLPKDGTLPDSAVFYRLVHPDDLAAVHRNKLSVAPALHAVQFEHRILRTTGEVRHLQQRVEMIFDPQGVPLRIIGTLHDITEQKKNEIQFFRGQRMETIGALSSGIVHDLNNVLGPVHMASELLLEQATDPQTVRLLGMILGSAKRGSDLVKQILTFAKGVTGERGVVELAPLLQDMANIVRHTFPKDIQLETAIGQGIHSVIGDPVQIHQVLLNLCTNARDAMPEGGVLTVSIANVRLESTVAGHSTEEIVPGPYVHLRVKDSGIGMPPEVRAHIFDLFYTTKAPDHGTGLGLATVQRIVEAHAGFILVESSLGHGSEFKIYLPACAPSSDAPPPLDTPFAAAGRGQLILVVDDEAAIRNLAQQLLELAGYQVVTASDGAQAVARCVEYSGRLKLMITDMAMPIMDGPQAIRAVRAILPDIRIIAASGTGGNGRADSGGMPGVDAELPKPYSSGELLKTVHAVLNPVSLKSSWDLVSGR